jgi:Arc/MetJ-type ribon-helix-helix transcriptional regulator
MLIQTKIQIDANDYNFVKMAFKELKYKSLCEYIRSAIHCKVLEDRKKWRQLQREKAMEMIGQTKYEIVFEPLEGEDFEFR